MATVAAYATPKARRATHFAAFIDAQTVRWTKPAAELLVREGMRAAAAFEKHGEGAALDAVLESEWFRYIERVWLYMVPAAGEIIADELLPFKASRLDPFSQAAINWLK